MGDIGQKEPSLESLIASAAGNGWDFFKHVHDPAPGDVATRELNARRERLAQVAAALATVPEFGELIEFLLDATLRRVTFISSLDVDWKAGYAFGQFREGQNALMFTILKLIAEGRRQEPPKGRDP